MSKLNHTDTPAAAEYATVYVAFELSKANWHLGVILPGSQKLRSGFRIDGGDLAALSVHLAKWRAKAATAGKPVQIVSCYEAGYDGHWLHEGADKSKRTMNQITEIDPASIQVKPSGDAAARERTGSDRSGAADEHAAALPARRAAGVQHGASAPGRRITTAGASRVSAMRLLKERSGHTNRITGLLHAQGIRDAKPFQRGFIALA